MCRSPEMHLLTSENIKINIEINKNYKIKKRRIKLVPGGAGVRGYPESWVCLGDSLKDGMLVILLRNSCTSQLSEENIHNH